MRVLFDGYWWVHGPGANRTVQREFILAWSEAFPADELVVALRRKHAGDRVDDLPEGVETVETRLWPQAVSNAVELPRLARRVGADAILAHNYAPASGRNLTFIHDVMFQEHPEWFSRAERAYFSLMPVLARRATLLATSTDTEAARIRRLNPRLPQATAVGLAVGNDLESLEQQAPAGAADLAAFAVTVGRLNIRKNLAASIEAAASAEVITPEQPLLIVGGSLHSGVETALTPASSAAVERGEARFLGHVTDAELAWLYAHAALVTNLSLDEGFGLPPIEAARFGAPLLVSDIPVFRETVGSVAHLVDPLATPQALGSAIDAAWGRPGTTEAYETLRERYDWAEVVAGLRAALAPASHTDRGAAR
ncbi:MULTISPECIES: glycosyltransferase [unclassified Plantibacter]|uniref:glycosyltransferase n=1 Tax=unclassified Plantibacter TaxID=2624265 RepID=UPI000AB61C29|nr:MULTISPECIES: glycosyltransferase [unclassified Plantibacter]